MTDEDKQAAALQKALDEGIAGEDMPEDALEAAALLRYSAGEDQLDPAAQRRILDQLMATPARNKRRRWPIFASAAAVACSIALWMVTTIQPQRSFAPPMIALLRAQTFAAKGDPAAAVELERLMRVYRQELLERGWMASE